MKKPNKFKLFPINCLLVNLSDLFQTSLGDFNINVSDLDRSSYQPSGTTALLDAVGRTVDSVGERLDKLEKSAKLDNVIVTY